MRFLKNVAKDAWRISGGKAVNDVKDAAGNVARGVKSHVGHWKTIATSNDVNARTEAWKGIGRHARKLGPGAVIGAGAAVGAGAMGMLGKKKTAASLKNTAEEHFKENSFLGWMVIFGFINFFVEFFNGWRTNNTTIIVDCVFFLILLVMIFGRGSGSDFFLLFIVTALELSFSWFIGLVGFEKYWFFAKQLWQFWIWGPVLVSWGLPKEEKPKSINIATLIMIGIIIYSGFVHGVFKEATESLTDTFETQEVEMSQEEWDRYSEACRNEASSNYQIGGVVDEWLSKSNPLGKKSPSQCVINKKAAAEKQEESKELLEGWREEQSQDHIKVKSKTYKPTQYAIEYELQISNPKDEISVTNIKCLNDDSSERDFSIYFDGKDYEKETEYAPELANLKGRVLPNGGEFYYPIDITCIPSGLVKGSNPHTIELIIEDINLKARSTLLYTNKEAVETMLYNYRQVYINKKRPQKPEAGDLTKWRKDLFNYYKEAYIFSVGAKETMDAYFPGGYVASTHLEKLAVIELGLIKGDYEAVPIIGIDPDEHTVLVWQIIIRNLEDFGSIETVKNVEVTLPSFMKPIKDDCDFELASEGRIENIYKLSEDALKDVKLRLKLLKKGKGFIPVVRECKVKVDSNNINLAGIFPREVEVRMDIDYKIEEEFKIQVTEEDVGPDGVPANVGNDPQIVQNNPDIVEKVKTFAKVHGVPVNTFIAILLQESRMSHYSKTGNVLHAGDDYGISQINEKAHKGEGCFSSVAKKSGMCAVSSCIGTNVKDSIDCNIEAGIKLLAIEYKRYEGKGVVVCGRTYTGWDAAVRAYNGIDPNCNGPTALYVENVNAREDVIIV